MAAFKFVGDPRMNGEDHTKQCEIFGMTFPAGETVPVEDEVIASRLRTHSHFAEVKRGRPKKTDGDA